MPEVSSSPTRSSLSMTSTNVALTGEVWVGSLSLTRLLQHFEVPGDGREADRERLGELRDGGVAVREPGEDRPAGRVCQRREDRAEPVRSHRV
jgi:hypothetical protein